MAGETPLWAEPTVPLRPRTLGVALILLVAGFAAGYLAGRSYGAAAPGQGALVERREGGFRFVNPLLECDLADDLLRNRELIPFKEQLADHLAARLAGSPDSAVSVYFRELNDGIWFGLGDTDRFAPASLRKLPMLIAVLKAAEQPGGGALLDRQVPFELARDYNLDQNVRPSQAMVPGRRYAVRELLERMIILSDNNAFTLLGRVVDPAELDRVYALLRMQRPGAAGDDGFLSVQTYASFFRILYNATYLGKGASDWALSLLARSEFRAGLVAGVPPEVAVAHKFGEKSDQATGRVQLHDCGIVYFPNNPYLLCIMSRGPDFQALDEVIVEVSRLVYQEVARQGPRPASP
ncbi:MAG: serine hydrolase [Bacteroidetes bacterium]|nr:serine hydrolase [Bacteroidota bacterium]